ncbi:P-loop containing nucleoside triphosphate hydrolase protein [Phlyctochytrium arcticum]|nr:P-loop containing nucleoside triphosphate hydrolase protein [Phlyctochytrium arcticum]
MAHLLGGGNRRKVGISFDIPLDTYLGISSVSVFPPRPDFDQTCQNQLPYIYSVENVYKLAFLLPRTSVVGNLDIHTLTSLARSGAAYHNAIAVAAGRLLSERPLSQVEVENVVATYIRLVRERGIDPETGFIQTLQTESDRKELDAFVAQYGVEAAFSPDSNPVVLPLVTSLLIQALAETSAERTALAQTKHGLAHAGLFGNPADRSRLSQREEKLLTQCLVRPDPSLTSFSQIGGLVRTKRTIGELIRLPLLHPELFDRGILSKSTTGILMFGPPGTGKTLLARAVAAESGANFLNVQMSDIQSMWVGENEKNVKALFSLARKLTPCVIFIDEIDALLRARQRGQANHVTNTINEFMQEWDGLQSAANKPGSQGGVIVVGATNRPFDLDEAVLRRLPRRILIDLPDRAARAEILRIHLKDDVVGDGTEADRERVVNEVAGLTDGWSGSDLRNICIAAAYASLRTHLGPITTSPFSSSSSTTSTNSKPLSRPPISLSDFTTSLEAGDVRPSLSDRAELTRQLKDWDKQYGTGSGYGLGTSSGGAWGFELEQQQQHKTHKGRRHVVGS